MSWFNAHVKCSMLKIRLVSDPEIIQSSDPSLLECKEGDRKFSIHVKECSALLVDSSLQEGYSWVMEGLMNLFFSKAISRTSGVLMTSQREIYTISDVFY